MNDMIAVNDLMLQPVALYLRFNDQNTYHIVCLNAGAGNSNAAFGADWCCT